MTRRLLNLGTALSLLLCVLAVALWVRTRVFHHQDQLSWLGQRSSAYAHSVGGKLWFTHIIWERRWWDEEPHGITYSHETDVVDFTPAKPPNWSLLGLGFHHSRGVSRSLAYTDTWVLVPHWMVAAAGVVLPGAWVYRSVRDRRRRRLGRCPGCGYDLTGNVSGVCPECGNSK